MMASHLAAVPAAAAASPAAELAAVARTIADAADPRRTRRGRRSSTLSGGNQQKVVLGKWLDDEAEGADARRADARRRRRREGRDLPAALRDGATQGIGILVSSSEMPELLTLCDRILVMFRGRVVASLSARGGDRGADRPLRRRASSERSERHADERRARARAAGRLVGGEPLRGGARCSWSALRLLLVLRGSRLLHPREHREPARRASRSSGSSSMGMTFVVLTARHRPLGRRAARAVGHRARRSSSTASGCLRGSRSCSRSLIGGADRRRRQRRADRARRALVLRRHARDARRSTRASSASGRTRRRRTSTRRCIGRDRLRQGPRDRDADLDHDRRLPGRVRRAALDVLRPGHLRRRWQHRGGAALGDQRAAHADRAPTGSSALCAGARGRDPGRPARRGEPAGRRPTSRSTPPPRCCSAERASSAASAA